MNIISFIVISKVALPVLNTLLPIYLLSGITTNNVEPPVAKQRIFSKQYHLYYKPNCKPKNKKHEKVTVYRSLHSHCCLFLRKSCNSQKKNSKHLAATLNAVVVTTGTKLMITAISELPNNINVLMKDADGNDLYAGQLIKGQFSQSAVFNLSELGEGTYSIVLNNGKEKCEKRIAVNTTKQVLVK